MPIHVVWQLYSFLDQDALFIVSDVLVTSCMGYHNVLYMFALKDKSEGTAGPECSRTNSDGHTSVHPFNLSVTEAVPLTYGCKSKCWSSCIKPYVSDG